MRWILLFLLSSVAASLSIAETYLRPGGAGIGFTLDQTHGTVSIASHAGKICNVAFIAGDAAYLEYMRNVTTGPSHNGAQINFPTYEPARRAQDAKLTPLESMLRDLTRAANKQGWRMQEPWLRGARISLPLAFADEGYAERFEFDFLNSLLSLRYSSFGEYEIGEVALARRGGICLANAHPLLHGTTKMQPTRRFIGSATQALTQVSSAGNSYSELNVRFGCSVDPELLKLWNVFGDVEEEIQSSGQRTIDGPV